MPKIRKKRNMVNRGVNKMALETATSAQALVMSENP